MTRKGGSSTSRPPDLEAHALRPEGDALLGSTLRRLRKERRLELAAVAAQAGLQVADLVRVERGTHRVGLDALVRILGVLGVSEELAGPLRAGGLLESRESAGETPGGSVPEHADPAPFPRRTRAVALREPLSLL